MFYFLGVMSRELKLGKHEKSLDAATEKVIVAVKAAKEVPRNALVWALTHVVHPGDSITLLVVVPAQSSGIISWLYQSLNNYCTDDVWTVTSSVGKQLFFSFINIGP